MLQEWPRRREQYAPRAHDLVHAGLVVRGADEERGVHHMPLLKIGLERLELRQRAPRERPRQIGMSGRVVVVVVSGWCWWWVVGLGGGWMLVWWSVVLGDG